MQFIIRTSTMSFNLPVYRNVSIFWFSKKKVSGSSYLCHQAGAVGRIQPATVHRVSIFVFFYIFRNSYKL
jgi:hypothetical protein